VTTKRVRNHQTQQTKPTTVEGGRPDLNFNQRPGAVGWNGQARGTGRANMMQKEKKQSLKEAENTGDQWLATGSKFTPGDNHESMDGA